MGNVLVLNYDYTPLNITSTRRGYVLVDKGKAEIIKSDENPIVAGYQTYVRPLIIRLLSYIRFNQRNLKANRTRIYKRDNHECAYCGSKKQLTLDHIIPKSRGGGNETPEEAKMVLKVKPYAPTLINENGLLNKIWNDYQESFVN